MTDKEKAEAKKKAEAEEKKKADGKGAHASPSATQGKEEGKKQSALIIEGCKAYGIDKKYVFASGIDKETGEAVIVTDGGKKVRYAKGDEVAELSQIEITGVNPEWKKRKPITG